MKVISTQIPSRPYRHYPALLVGAMLLTVGLANASLADERAASVQGFAAAQPVELDGTSRAMGQDPTILHLTSVQSIQKMEASTNNNSFNVGGDMVSGNIHFDIGNAGNFSGTGIFNAITGNANAVNNGIGISVYVSQ